MKGLLIALQFMTRLPGPRLTVSAEEFAASMRWFPATGIVVGLCVAAGFWTGGLIDPWLAALGALVVWVGVTGALHLDGLGDVADAIGAAHKDRTRMRAVLADPHVGSFAVVAIAMLLIAKLILLHLLAEHQAILPLLLIPFAARIGPLLWSRALPPLHDGLGGQFRDAAVRGTGLLWAILLFGAACLVPALAVAIPLMLIWILALRSSLGGISGDGHGAGIELVETGLLLATAIVIKGG